MKAVKKYLAVMMSIFMIAGVMPAAVYASPEENDVAEEILVAEEAAPVPDLDEEAGPESIETVDEASEVEAEAIIPEEPSALYAGESSEEAPGLDIDGSSEMDADEIENEVPEEIVGAGVKVGEGVTATFDSATGEVTFTSNGGTLWNDWISKSGFEASEIKSIGSTGKLYLPADSSSLFMNLSNLTNLDTYYFDTTNVTNMMFMFYNCSSLTSLDLGRFDTSKVTNMFAMFGDCSSLTSLDLGSFNTANLTIISCMFLNCTNLSTLVLTNFDLSKVTSNYAKDVFSDCNSLKLLGTPKKTSCLIDLPVTLYNRTGIEHTAIPVLSASLILAKNKELAKGNLIVGDCVTGKFTSSTGALSLYSDDGTLWYGWKKVPGIEPAKIKSIGVSHGIVYLPPNSSEMFRGCTSLTNLDLSSFDTSNVIYMSNMFYHCGNNLTSLDLSSFNTSKVKDMSSMFYNCSSLTNLDLSSFNTSKIEDMTAMFYGCSSLTNLDLSSFNTSNVTNMIDMFSYCSSLTNLDLSNFDTSNVTDMSSMFFYCSSLTNLDLSSFNTSHVKYMNYMFFYCSSLTNLNLSSFDTSNVAYFSGIFSDCTNLEVLRTPKKHTESGATLPLTMYDNPGKAYTELPVLSKNIVLGKTQKIAHEYVAKPISECTVTLKPTSYTYDGKTKKPAVTVKDGTKTLTSGTDYTAAYSKNKNAGTAVVTITATETGNYKGTKTANFTIKKADAGLAFAESSIKKKSTDAAFTNALTKATTAAAAFTSDNTAVATVDSATGEVTIKGVGTATIKAETKAATNYNAGSATYLLTVEAPPTPTATGFSDVQDPKHAYYKAIYWAADAGITKGYPDGTFGINRDCTRGEMMMFLWRYAGKKEPTPVSKSPFKDVPKTHTFYKAILWGSQKGITKGYSDGTFGVDRNVSRGECMMFLWRLKGKPAPTAVAKAPFPDVPKSHVFYNAVLWGYQKKITTGFTSGPLKGKFGVNENCSRGQIVTFLYRARSI
ncbi:MAG: BspA family leucine-rich repeat surface protein [Lachnospiraceae bacterium]|nr:BspA family leucine-rich repeat surface protein [Lachnospiraceae bacterium]